MQPEKLIALSSAQIFKSGNRERLVMITQARLKELLHYNPDSGIFTWLASRRGRAKIGCEAGTILQARRTYYRVIGIDGDLHKAHRLAWLYIHGQLPANQIDHEDGNGLHNWSSNLRDVTNRENQRNARLRSDNTSGTAGVYFVKGRSKWRAQIRTESGNKHLGLFTNIEDAISARQAADVEYGFHGNHGSIREAN